jgi:hypothetical protein
MLGKPASPCHITDMSLAELISETATLSPAEQKELTAFLAILRMKQSGEWDEAVTDGESQDRRGWISLNDVKRQLAQGA